MQKLSVVIVNWNTGKLLFRCLAALDKANSNGVVQEVVVVDNQSSDGSYATAKGKRYQTPITWKRLKRNAGFARANNIAIDYLIHTHGIHHILLLNPDTEVQLGALEELMAALERNPKAGIIGPKLLHSDGSLQESVRRFPSVVSFGLFFLKLGRLARLKMPGFSYDTEATVDQVMGAAFLIRDKALEAVGPLNEKYWIWFEEVDYCKRALAAGWKTVYTPTAEVIHHGGVSFSQLAGFRKSLPFLSSSLIYTRLHLGFFPWLLLLLLLPVSILLTIPASALHVFMRRRNKKRL